MTIQTVFERHEKKYLISHNQLAALNTLLRDHAKRDEYGLHTICTQYYDTPDMRSFRQREDRSAYREKLRLRSYGVPVPGDTVFLELKKKLGGITHKRRLPLPFSEARAYLSGGQQPSEQGQVFGEIDWFIGRMQPEAKMIICYDRIALYGMENPQLRITFDFNIRYRNEVLDLSQGDWGSRLLASGEVLMEIKTDAAIPMWLATAFSQAEIYPVSFSKFSNVYEELIQKGVRQHAG